MKDLTVGSPSKLLWRFCLPLFLSVILQQIYNLADSLVAGKLIGEGALAAVGNGYEITLILLAFSVGINIGVSVIASNLFGAKKYSNLKTASYTAFISSGVLVAILMILAYAFLSPLLRVINTPECIFNDSMSYLKIYILGFPFILFYNIATGIFQALGDSKTPFYFLFISSISNIILDIVFVKYLNLGVNGLAWATFICQSIASIFVMTFLIKRLRKLYIDKVSMFSKYYFKKIAMISIPSILQQSSVSIGNILIQSIINSFGEGVIAGYAAAIKLNNLVITTLGTVGNGISSFTAQNIGANKYSRVKQGFKASTIMNLLIVLPISLSYVFLSKELINLFIASPTDEAIKSGSSFLMIVAPFYLLVSINMTADGVLRGSGLMSRFMISTMLNLAIRVILAFILAKQLGSIGIWLSWPIGWVISLTLSLIFYHNGYYNKDSNLKSVNIEI